MKGKAAQQLTDEKVRVYVDLDERPGYGRITKFGRSGTSVEMEDGRRRVVAWWRIREAA